MGKKLFSRKNKEMTDEQIRDVLATSCVPTKAPSTRTSKFSAYSEYAEQLNAQRNQGVPMPGSAGPIAQSLQAQVAGPYGGAAAASGPYGAPIQQGPGSYGQNLSPYGQQSAPSPYANQGYHSTPSLSPYANNGYGQQQQLAQEQPRAYSQQQGPAYGQQSYSGPVPYGQQTYSNPPTTSPYAAGSAQYQSRFNPTPKINNPLSDTDSVLDARRNELFGNAPQQAALRQDLDTQQQQQQQQVQAQPQRQLAPDRAALFGAAAHSESDLTTSKYSSAFNDSLAQQSAQARFKAKDPSEYTNDEELIYAGRNQGESTTTDNTDSTTTDYQPYGAQQEQEVNSEDEEVEAIKTQMKFIKNEDVNLTRSALRAAAYAEESGRNALGMLGAQGERLSSVERNLQLASTQNRIASDKTRELKTLNRSMFAVHVSNPFNSKRRLMEKEEQIKANRLREQVARESLRANEYESQQRIMNGLGMGSGVGNSATAQKYKRNLKDRVKYQIEPDEEDDQLEDEIEGNLDALHNAAQRLHKLAIVTNEEITRQNDQLSNLTENVDTLDIGVHLNSNRLMNIH